MKSPCRPPSADALSLMKEERGGVTGSQGGGRWLKVSYLQRPSALLWVVNSARSNEANRFSSIRRCYQYHSSESN